MLMMMMMMVMVMMVMIMLMMMMMEDLKARTTVQSVLPGLIFPMLLYAVPG
jgi:hypothetical protein